MDKLYIMEPIGNARGENIATQSEILAIYLVVLGGAGRILQAYFYWDVRQGSHHRDGQR